jgi:hypothetical protein
VVAPGPTGSNVTSSVVDQVGHLNQDTTSKLQFPISGGFMPSFKECFKQVSIQKEKRNTFSLRPPLSLRWLLLIHQDRLLPCLDAILGQIPVSVLGSVSPGRPRSRSKDRAARIAPTPMLNPGSGF